MNHMLKKIKLPFKSKLEIGVLNSSADLKVILGAIGAKKKAVMNALNKLFKYQLEELITKG